MFHYNLNKSVFYKRIQRFYAAWKDESIEDYKVRFPKMDAFVSSTSRKEGRFSHFKFYLTLKDNMSYCKSSTFQRWLFGYEFIDTIIVFTKEAVLIFTHERNISVFKQLQDDEVQENAPAVKFFFRKEEDESENYLKKIISEIKDSGEGKKIGIFTDDKFHSPFMKEWEIILKKENFEMVDISAAFGLLISSKEEIEIETIKKNSDRISMRYKKYGLFNMEVTADSEKKVLPDQSLCNKIPKNILINNPYLLGADYYIYPDISVKSGWNFCMRSNVIRRKNLRVPDTMIILVQARYQSYFSTFTRTVLVEPTDSMKENYQFLLEVAEEVIKNLKAGAKLCDVYNAGFAMIENKKPHLIRNVKGNFGFAMGIELREPSVAIAPESTITLSENMVFNVEVGFSNLSNEDEFSKENKLYSLFIGDTVLVNGNGPATILTSYSNKVEDLTFFWKDQGDENNEEDLIVVEISPREREARRKRKEHQKKLSAQLHESLKLRLLQKSTQNSDEKDEKTEKETSVEHLILSTNGKNPKLTDFLIRPNIHPEPLAGVLEIHENGLRYTSARGDKVDVLFSNIKNAFYHSCCEKMIVLLHFHLKHPIMVAEEKHIDVQFYMKITDLKGHGLAAGESVEDFMGIKKMQLEMFCKEVENIADFKFDTPLEELVIRNLSGEVLLQSTRDGLVSLNEWPVCVISLKDIELVQLAKVCHQDFDTFDMIMIFKNYLKEPAIINDIPKKMLNDVEEWLDSHDIKYSEMGQVIRNWAIYLKHILKNPDDYLESGGWGRYDQDSEVEEEDEDEDEIVS